MIFSDDSRRREYRGIPITAEKRRANDSALFAFCSLKGLFTAAQCSHSGVVAVINRIAQIRENVFLPLQEVRSAEPCRNGVMGGHHTQILK